MNKKLIITFFVLMCALQWLVPARMIARQEFVISNGATLKLRTEPVDPNDPFRGKFIVLRFSENVVRQDPDEQQWVSGDNLYLTFEKDSAGFDIIKTASRNVPDEPVYVRVVVNYPQTAELIEINYPFQQFYMEEFKALPAEDAYRRAMVDQTKVTYAIVKVQDGDAVITDVMIDDRSIIDIVNELLEQGSEDAVLDSLLLE